ncbi:MAG: 30S ribosomal protein S6 [Deltaproteobacteria bacterium]|nr:30S ribosomal protein S6 [Deltaproteobacteria bacterium]MBW2067684.1 30S ribosomal protein S6 [Deltaproteobacteria bacterium]
MYMRKYEVFFIVDPDLNDEETTSIEKKFREIVEREGGRVLTYKSWGKKRLAYPVKKRTRGHYFLMEMAGDSELPLEVERNMRIDDRVLKFITVKLEDRYDPTKDQTPEPQEPAEEERVNQTSEEAETVENASQDTIESGLEVKEEE